MAINVPYPRDLVFEKTQISSFGIGRGYVSDDCSDKTMDGVGNLWEFSFELNNIYDRKSEKISDNIVDMLPSDPFGMDMNETFNAITSWIEEFEKDFELRALGFVMDETDVKEESDRIYVGMNVVLNGALKFSPEVSDACTDDNHCSSGNFVHESEGVTKDSCNGGAAGAPHDALLFVLGHLGVQDRLAVERVCKTLCNAVRNDPLIWRNIHVTWPLSDRITDDILFSLAGRAKGGLQCLNLVKCRKITDSGLKRVLETNQKLVKLGVPGCSRLSIEGIVNNLKISKEASSPRIKNLRIGGIFGPTQKDFEELMCLLDHNSSSASKPWYYRGAQPYLSIDDDDRAIDIEACPKCQRCRQIYDCPADSCQVENRATCRACIYCVARCYVCGRCIKNCDFVETFNLDLVCMPCWKQFYSDDHGRAETPLALSQTWQLPVRQSWIFLN